MHGYVDFLLHLDRHLLDIIAQYGTVTYVILFVILFAETGLVVAPFLPGDSLLFAVGTVTAAGALNIGAIFSLLLLAVFLGDNVNYWIGYYVGPRIFTREDVRLLNKRHLERTREFFARHGPKCVIYARFVPFVRTCTPFVAGIGRMPYLRFLTYSVVGCLLWLSLCLLGGYFFGQIPVVKKNFSLAILGVILISLMPLFIEYLRHRRAS